VKTIHKAILGLALIATPLIAQADLSVRERNIAIGGLVVGALIGNSMQPNSMPQINTMPMYNMQSPAYYAQPAMNQCEVRYYRQGYIQNCYPTGHYRITPPIIPHPTPYPQNINFYYVR